MNKCERNQKHLSSAEYDGNTLANIYFGKDGFPFRNNLEGSKQAVKHVQNCNACKSWLKNRIPKTEYERLSRIQKYCCPIMYGSVEKSRMISGIHLSYRQYRDDPTWILDWPGRKAGIVEFSFCPWCGSKLPNEPFINDETGKG